MPDYFFDSINSVKNYFRLTKKYFREKGFKLTLDDCVNQFSLIEDTKIFIFIKRKTYHSTDYSLCFRLLGDVNVLPYQIDIEGNVLEELFKFIVERDLVDKLPAYILEIFYKEDFIEKYKDLEKILKILKKIYSLQPKVVLGKWDQRFLDLAKEISNWSYDPECKVGCVLVNNKLIVSTGFNGFPFKCDDDLKLYENKETKLNRIVHAEANAITQCSLAGRSSANCTLYSTKFPCLNCAKLLISSGIVRLVTYKCSEESSWYNNYVESKKILLEAGIDIVEL